MDGKRDEETEEKSQTEEGKRVSQLMKDRREDTTLSIVTNCSVRTSPPVQSLRAVLDVEL